MKIINHRLIGVISILIVAMDINLLVVIMINLVNQCKFIEIKKQFICLLKKVLKDVEKKKKKMGKRIKHDSKKTENDFEIDDRYHKCDKLYDEKHI